jgi:hypothetical protein
MSFANSARPDKEQTDIEIGIVIDEGLGFDLRVGLRRESGRRVVAFKRATLIALRDARCGQQLLSPILDLAPAGTHTPTLNYLPSRAVAEFALGKLKMTAIRSHLSRTDRKKRWRFPMNCL